MKLVNLFQQKIARSTIVGQVDEEMTLNIDYLVLLVLSIVIGTVGIMMDNNAVIIGSMIISPLLWPIVGIALAVVRSDRRFFLKALWSLVVSIAVTLLVATLLSLLLFTGIFEINQEIGSRIAPNFLDLIVALAAGFAAPLIMSWGRLTTSAAGVAIAAALLPPLSVSGIGLSVGNVEIFTGSLILFGTNLTSIIFASMIVFRAAGYQKHGGDQEQERTLTLGIGATLAILATLGAQLFFSLVGIANDTALRTSIYDTLSMQLPQISEDVSIDHVEITPFTGEQEQLQVLAVLRASDDLSLTVLQKDILTDAIAQSINQNVLLDLRVLPSLELITQDSEQKQQELVFQRMIDSQMISYLRTIDPLITLDTVRYSGHIGDPKRLIRATLLVPEFVQIRESDIDELEQFLSDQSGTTIELDLQLISTKGVSETQSYTKEQLVTQELYDAIQTYMSEYVQEGQVHLNETSITFNEERGQYEVKLHLLVPEGEHDLTYFLKELKSTMLSSVSLIKQNEVLLEAQVSTYQTFVY